MEGTKVYRYWTLSRPPMPGAIPNGATEVEEFDIRMVVPGVKRMVWGIVSYARELTKEEIDDYELAVVEG